MTSALDWLRPRDLEPLTDAGLLDDGLAGARYDGLVTPAFAGRAWAVDVLATAEGRARAAGAELPRGGAIARLSAVWVHTGRVRPARLEVLVPSQCRVQSAAIIHRQRIAPGDVELLGGVATTTPTRTAVDLLCHAPDGAAVAGTRALLTAGLEVRAVLTALDTGPGRAVERATALLARARGGPGEERR